MEPARQAVEEARAEIPLRVPEEPFDASGVRGEEIYFINVVENQFTRAVAEGFEEAARELGAEPVVFNGKGQASEWNAGVSRAVSADAGGIVLFGIAPNLVSRPLERAEASGIPVIDVFNGQPDDPLEGPVQAHVTSDYTKSGVALANWTMMDSGCDADTVLFASEALTLYEPFKEQMPRVYEEECPECSFEYEEVDLATIATEVGPQASNVVRRNPELDYIFPAFDSLVTFIEPAVERTGWEGKILGHDGVAASLDAIREDRGLQKVTMAFPPEAWIGWATADQISRIAAGAEPWDATIPTRLVDTSNAGESNEDIYGNWGDWRANFRETWQD